ncbi:MAG TPA: DNA translocase FtsK, partial [Ktedonobacterales bacterium]|nr:DNA translocase FtsK [Ktedonobacterales bacterium]
SQAAIEAALPEYEGIERVYVSRHTLDLGDDSAQEALRIPAYLRHGPLATNPLPLGATLLRPKVPPLPTTPAPGDFTLPPLALRHSAETQVATSPTADPVAEIAEILRIANGESPPVASGEHAVAIPPIRLPRSEAYPVIWSLPPLSLLNRPPESRATAAQEHATRLASVIERTLKSFGVEAEVRRSDISVGPTIIRFGIRPVERARTDERGRAMVDSSGAPITVRTRVSRIMNLKDDLALVLEVKTLRMEAPVPERPYVGVEIPNSFGRMVSVREILESHEFGEMAAKSKLAVVLGRDVAGHVRVGDLARFPHVLVAGATGAGKSVCLNAMISSLITQATPAQVRLVMIDPKMVELMMYDGIPHLLTPVITDPRRVVGVLDAAIDEMECRYRLFSKLGVRNLDGYDLLRANQQRQGDLEPLPHIVLIVDELADLMMVAADDIERQICRLAQLARATGIHLVVATQRPSVDVITGLIKANIPTRIAFMTSSAVDSRTILDATGAEKLLGKGDMLYLASDAAKAERIQGAYVADDEVERIARFWRKQADALGAVPSQWDISVAYDTDIS